MSEVTLDNQTNYNTSKWWKIGLFALNNTATNLYLFIIGFVSYYVTGIAGLAVVAASAIIGGSRVFDAITDPIIGFIIDKTEGKFGKFRPLMIAGNIILAGSVLIIYNVTHLLPESMQLIFFALMYGIYIIGYTLQTACTKAAQTVLTNHPKQRPLFTIYDSIYSIGVFTGGQIFVANYLMEKYNDNFTMELFAELNMYGIALSGLFTILATIAIWQKDRKEYFGLAKNNVKTRFRDYWPILKGNRALQMLVLAASTDKITVMVMRQPAVYVMFFGIMMGDYALSGTMSAITIIPAILITFLGVNIATKTGLKSALVKATWIGILSAAFLFIFFLIVDPSTVTLDNLGITTIIFLIAYSILQGIEKLTTPLVMPMIADVADYETYKSGRYVPGMIGTAFSLIDKVMSSLAPVIVGLAVGFIGYKDEFPQVGEALTQPLLITTLILMFGVPIFGWMISLIAMKFYPLDHTKMAKIQQAISDMKKTEESDT
ncbi:MFS transporter [Gracilibacillus massiliensis]|uniref:MFS transporter n=1 Tax=Gracilibacillus massiliensis TaxID=1564956 RepID=UPI00071D26C3|nr:MFS transporter [Gracilibacillus massiliensis]